MSNIYEGSSKTVRVVAKKNPDHDDDDRRKRPSTPKFRPEAWKLWFALPLLYSVTVPMAEYVARLRLATPIVQAAVTPLTKALSAFGFLNAQGTIGGSLGTQNMVARIALFFTFMVWGVSTVASVIAQIRGDREGYNNKEPRQRRANLTGLHHRMNAAHQNMVETFSLFVLVAGLTQMLAPNDPHLIELLSIFACFKGVLYMPSYMADMDALRSICHGMSSGAAFRILTILAVKAL